MGKTPDVVRLWRGSSLEPQGKIADWIAESQGYKNTVAATGRWFTHNREDALWYIEHEHNGKGQLLMIDLPRDVALVYRVDQLDGGPKDKANTPRAFSKSPETEYFLPIEVARRAQPEPPSTPLPEIPTLSKLVTIPESRGLTRDGK